MRADLEELPRVLLPPSAAPQARTGGTVVAAVGAAIAVAAWAALPSDPGVAGAFFALIKLLLTAFGGAFVALGMGLGWSRVGAAVDRERGRLLLLRRVGPWQRARELPLGSVRRLEVAGGGDPARPGPGWIEVQLGGGGGRVTFGLGQSAAALRRLAAWIRDWSGLPAEVFVGLEPGEAVRPLAPEPDEVRRALERLGASPVRVERGADSLVVEVPAVGWRGYAVGMAVGAVGSAGLVAAMWRLALRGTFPQGPALAGMVLLSVVPLALLVGAFWIAGRRVVLAVTEGMLRVESRGAFGTRREAIPGEEIVHLEAAFLGGQQSARWGLVVLGRGRVPLLTLTHPALDRRREGWEDVAVLVREALVGGGR